jgi:hypothetical protein
MVRATVSALYLLSTGGEVGRVMGLGDTCVDRLAAPGGEVVLGACCRLASATASDIRARSCVSKARHRCWIVRSVCNGRGLRGKKVSERIGEERRGNQPALAALEASVSL